jgi:hypothetical protein
LLLGVAMLWILWHGGRFLDFACRILLPRISRPTLWAMEACVAALLVLILAWPAPQSAGATASGSTTRGERVLWAVGSGLRRVILADFDFGYNPAAAGDLSGTALESLLPRVQSRADMP